MIFAFARLLFFAVSTVAVAVIVVFSLRVMGEKQNYPSMRHPIAEMAPITVDKWGSSQSGPPQSLAALSAAVKSNPHIFLGITIRKTLDGHWVLYAPQNLNELTEGSGYVGQFNLDELKKIKYKSSEERILSLDEVLQAFPQSYFSIEIYQPSTIAIDGFNKSIQNANAENRVIVASPFQDTTRELRKINYKWLTGNSTSENAKSRFMAALFLETTMDIPADVVTVDKFNTRLITELIRRNKLVLYQSPDPATVLELQKISSKIGQLTTRHGY